jgi:hypothetical protein
VGYKILGSGCSIAENGLTGRRIDVDLRYRVTSMESKMIIEGGYV